MNSSSRHPALTRNGRHSPAAGAVGPREVTALLAAYVQAAADEALSPGQWDRFADLVADKVVDRLHSRPRLVDQPELAEQLGLSVATIQRLVAAGRIPSIHVGSRRKYDPTDVLAALKDAERMEKEGDPRE